MSQSIHNTVLRCILFIDPNDEVILIFVRMNLSSVSLLEFPCFKQLNF